MSRDRGSQLGPRPAAIRPPAGDKPAARAAEVLNPVESAETAQPAQAATRSRRTDRSVPHRTTVVYPQELLQALKIAAIHADTSVGDLVRAALTTALKAPRRLATTAAHHVGVTGTRTTIDLDAAQHRSLKVLAAEHGLTVQSLVLAALAENGLYKP